VDKVSYVQGFEPWGWVVGSGIYVDDLQRSGASCRGGGHRRIAAMLLAGYLFLSFYRVMDGGLRETPAPPARHDRRRPHHLADALGQRRGRRS
jgi:methyl-accepting chemotaxis protein